MSDRIHALMARVAAGGALSDTDVETLAESVDILTLGMLADDARRRAHGADTTFVRVHDVDLAAVTGDLTIQPSAREVRVRGLWTAAPGTSAALRAVVAAAGPTPVSAFSLADLEQAAEAGELSLADILQAVRHAGVSLVAEAPIDALVQAEACLDAVRAAGLGLARLTVARNGDRASRVALVKRAAELQHALGWIRSFAPLPRQWDPAMPTTGYEDVRQVALARLVADNIPSIQVDWALYGPKLAQVALTVGADDVDSVSASDETPDGRRRAPIEEIRRNIEAAGLAAVERDGAYARMGA
jgi:aminodeoxyfutalosine synthase